MNTLPKIVIGISCAAMGIGATITPAHASPSAPNIHYGARGFNVQCVQYALTWAYSPSLKIDGVYGPKTREALLLYQKNYRLVQDGIVGPKTGDRLLYEIRDAGAAGASEYNTKWKYCHDVLPTSS